MGRLVRKGDHRGSRLRHCAPDPFPSGTNISFTSLFLAKVPRLQESFLATPPQFPPFCPGSSHCASVRALTRDARAAPFEFSFHPSCTPMSEWFCLVTTPIVALVRPEVAPSNGASLRSLASPKRIPLFWDSFDVFLDWDDTFWGRRPQRQNYVCHGSSPP